jgi:predicted dehydrogenase
VNQNKRKITKRKLDYGLIGCGRIAMNHINALLSNKASFELKALCDIDPDNCYELIKKCEINKYFKNIKIYKSHQDLLKNEKLDLVAVATESGSHAKISLDCLFNNINVIVEKPMALSIKDADKMIRVANKKKLKLCVSHQNRFNKSIQKLRKAQELGKFGKLFYGVANIRWNRCQDYYKQANWRGTWEHDGGALMNQCIHNIDLLIWMMGEEIDEVFAYTANLNHPYIVSEDLGLALIKFKNGSFGIIEGTVNIFPQNLEETLSIFGSNGTVRVGGKSVNKIEIWNLATETKENNKDSEEVPPNIYGFGHNELYKDMVDAIKNNRQPYIDGIQGKRALEVVLAIYKSAKEGTPVKLPLKEFSTLKMIKK